MECMLMHVNHSNKHSQTLEHSGFSPSDSASLLYDTQTHVAVLLCLLLERLLIFFLFQEESSAGADIKRSSLNGRNPSWLQ